MKSNYYTLQLLNKMRRQNEKQTNNKTNNKTNKAVKAVLPFFALIGGNAIASNRGSSVLLSSKKGKSNSIIYVDDTNAAPELPQLNAIQKSPFAVFTNNANVIASTDKSQVDSSCLDFLKKNELLGSSTTVISKVSGDIVNDNSKSLAHQLTNLNASFTIDFVVPNRCANTNYNFFVFGSASKCTWIFGTIGASEDLAVCKAKHNECMNDTDSTHTHAQQLPVELEAFEVE